VESLSFAQNQSTFVVYIKEEKLVMKFIAAIPALLWATTLAYADDSRVGYYYPEVSSEEGFERVIRDAGPSSKAVRVDFINRITQAQISAPESPRFVFYAKGHDASTLIMTALDDEIFSTIYRARAIMAQLTVNVRQNGFFKQEQLQYVATFYDLLQLMQFDELMITDGETWTHRVSFNR
jgi:hypothetical protein